MRFLKRFIGRGVLETKWFIVVNRMPSKNSWFGKRNLKIQSLMEIKEGYWCYGGHDNIHNIETIMYHHFWIYLENERTCSGYHLIKKIPFPDNKFFGHILVNSFQLTIVEYNWKLMNWLWFWNLQENL